MQIVNLVQGTSAWLKWREKGLGSSEVHHLTGVAPWSNRDQLKRVKQGKEKIIKNAAMERGNLLEPEVRTKVSMLRGQIFRPVCIISDRYPWLKASLDGLSEDGKTAIEIKVPTNPKVHRVALEGNPPDYYIPQLQYELLASDGTIETVLYCSYHPDFPSWEQLVVIPETSRVEYQEVLLEEAIRFAKEMNWSSDPSKGGDVF